MKLRTCIVTLLLIFAAFSVFAEPVHLPARMPTGATGFAPLEATNTLLTGALINGPGTAYDLGASGINHSCVASWLGLTPTNIVWNLEGSLDGLIFVTMAQQTTTPPAEKITNGTFTGAATSWTVGTGWAYGTNNVVKSAGTAGNLSQAVGSMVTTLIAGEYYTMRYTVSSYSASGVVPSFGGVTCTAPTANGIYECSGLTTSNADPTFTGSSASAMTLDDVTIRKNGDPVFVSSKPFRYIRANRVSLSGGDATTGLTVQCVSSSW